MWTSSWWIMLRVYGGTSKEVFRKIIQSCKPTEELGIKADGLFQMAIMHLAVDAGWKIDELSQRAIGEYQDELPPNEGHNLPLSKDEFRLAETSLRIVLKLSLPPEAMNINIKINHKNWYRSRFIQECIVRVGLNGYDLFAIDSPIVAPWILENGDVTYAMARCRKVRGAFLDRVQPCIMEKVGDTTDTKKRKID
jgi:hypothetical protein